MRVLCLAEAQHAAVYVVFPFQMKKENNSFLYEQYTNVSGIEKRNLCNPRGSLCCFRHSFVYLDTRVKKKYSEIFMTDKLEGLLLSLSDSEAKKVTKEKKNQDIDILNM